MYVHLHLCMDRPIYTVPKCMHAYVYINIYKQAHTQTTYIYTYIHNVYTYICIYTQCICMNTPDVYIVHVQIQYANIHIHMNTQCIYIYIHNYYTCIYIVAIYVCMYVYTYDVCLCMCSCIGIHKPCQVTSKLFDARCRVATASLDVTSVMQSER